MAVSRDGRFSVKPFELEMAFPVSAGVGCIDAPKRRKKNLNSRVDA